MSNPNVEHATALTLTYTKYKDGKLVIYPRMETICEAADQFRKELTADDDSNWSISSLNLNGKSFYFYNSSFNIEFFLFISSFLQVTCSTRVCQVQVRVACRLC